ncbi:MAG: GntR family transcriptional regulator [Proteobacteria bacterium]|nr:GntR family transcriptional regulator [Pseudomonadota bacterium]
MPSASIQSGIASLQRKENLSERIYNDLRERLQRGSMLPEERLVDKDLAAAYGASRMPAREALAREALLRLVNDGYLIGTSRGFAIPTLSLEKISDLFEVRRLLEPQAAANAARHMNAATVAELTAAMHQARAAVADNDAHLMILANMAFRNAWLSRVANRSLADTIARFVDHVQTIRLSTLRDPAARRVVVEGLEGIFAALVKGDATQTKVRMAAFLAAAERVFFSIRKAELDTMSAVKVAP